MKKWFVPLVTQGPRDRKQVVNNNCYDNINNYDNL